MRSISVWYYYNDIMFWLAGKNFLHKSHLALVFWTCSISRGGLKCQPVSGHMCACSNLNNKVGLKALVRDRLLVTLCPTMAVLWRLSPSLFSKDLRLSVFWLLGKSVAWPDGMHSFWIVCDIATIDSNLVSSSLSESLWFRVLKWLLMTNTFTESPARSTVWFSIISCPLHILSAHSKSHKLESRESYPTKSF